MKQRNKRFTPAQETHNAYKKGAGEEVSVAVEKRMARGRGGAKHVAVEGEFAR